MNDYRMRNSKANRFHTSKRSPFPANCREKREQADSIICWKNTHQRLQHNGECTNMDFLHRTTIIRRGALVCIFLIGIGYQPLLLFADKA